jgi:CRISPR-associated protein Csb1
MDLSTLGKIVADHSGIRRNQILQPLGGAGAKVFPPTYKADDDNAGPEHCYERRFLNGEEVHCVVMNSVAAQANEYEEAIIEAVDNGLLLPYIYTDFSGTDLGEVQDSTTLSAPHRLYDSMFRDSLLDGAAFYDTAIGRAINSADPRTASAILEVSPTTLVFGAWNSRGGTRGGKFRRVIASEICGVRVPVDLVPSRKASGSTKAVTAAKQTSSRRDSIGILSTVPIYKGANGWALTEAEAGKGAKKVRASDMNIGGIPPSFAPRGATFEYAEESTTLTLAGIRGLRFGSPSRNEAGRLLVAALALVAITEKDCRGHSLRSGCDLVPDGGIAPLHLIATDGTTEALEIDRDAARAMYLEALSNARSVGFDVIEEPIRLTPKDELVELIRRSRDKDDEDASAE